MMGTSAVRRRRGIAGAIGTSKAGSEEALVAKVIYHLAVQHPEAHATLEQADELVGTEAYDEPS